MPPKTPKELEEQIEAQNSRPSKDGHERTAEGLSVETPKRGDFFGNLDKIAGDEPRRKGGESPGADSNRRPRV